MGLGGPDFTGVALGEDCSVFEGSGGGVSLPMGVTCTCLFKLSLSYALEESAIRTFKALFFGCLDKSGSLASVSYILGVPRTGTGSSSSSSSLSSSSSPVQIKID